MRGRSEETCYNGIVQAPGWIYLHILCVWDAGAQLAHPKTGRTILLVHTTSLLPRKRDNNNSLYHTRNSRKHPWLSTYHLALQISQLLYLYVLPYFAFADSRAAPHTSKPQRMWVRILWLFPPANGCRREAEGYAGTAF